ncbi:hypothetical protein [uncultured Prevotella sp.]|uniref:hypothetical protein n=1 Tax=uncultured Prevotella sp. TaxID=159272 RepID=UPI0025EA3B8E|nr:hypothetical protein [uncultured Prevotella sp.]
MATMTQEQIEQKKQQLAEKMKEVKALYDELKEAGAITPGKELSDDELDEIAGGRKVPTGTIPAGFEKAMRDWDNLTSGRYWLL